jgi:tRNA(fMet)-specific endonuclease VapC
MKTVAIDTNIAIAYLNGKSEKDFFVDFDEVYLPITVLGELRFGAENSAKRNENINKIDILTEKCKVLDINSSVAAQYAITRKQLKNIGKPIPENDIWIAAICITNNLSLDTDDAHFHFVSELNLI